MSILVFLKVLRAQAARPLDKQRTPSFCSGLKKKDGEQRLRPNETPVAKPCGRHGAVMREVIMTIKELTLTTSSCIECLVLIFQLIIRT